MRILVLHSDVGPDAPADDLDTLTTAEAVAGALAKSGHTVVQAPFVLSREHLARHLDEADAVFNLVESVLGADSLSSAAPALLEQFAVPFTGSGSAPIALAGDKPLAKRTLRAAQLPTPDWAEPSRWDGLDASRPFIVKSATEDASLGLDDGACVEGPERISARVQECAKRYGGRWFAEAFVDGREFNVALIEEHGTWRVLPIAEMRFDEWPSEKPKIVGYRAKWDDASEESLKTVRGFGIEVDDPALAETLADLSLRACRLFALKGYARVDFRVDPDGRPMILEANPNPCLDPNAGFAAAAAAAGLSYGTLIARLLDSALER